jgi:hypothetical protein
MNGAMTAKKLRLTLLVVMALVIAAVAGGFLFVERNLRDYATSISRLNADAQSGDQNIQTFKNLEKRLSEEQSTIAAARSIVADNTTYTKQVIDDISRIAAESGVVVTSLEFPKDAASAATPAAPTTATPGQTTTTTPAPAGVTKKTITVSVQSPLKYSNLLSFIQKIETNDLKMQLTSVTLAKEKDDAVTTQTFNIEVYVRQ